MMKQVKTYLNVYPMNAKSLLSPVTSAPAGVSGTASNSSVGKYDVSVIDLKCGTNGASICLMHDQSTPANY